MERSVFSDYEPEGFFDEAFQAPGVPRPHYDHLVRTIEMLGNDELIRRAELRDASFSHDTPVRRSLGARAPIPMPDLEQEQQQ